MLDKIGQAKLVAVVGHAGQKRKHSGIAYFNHPQDVVNILEAHATNLTRRMIQAAYLHDLVEDTKVTIDMINDAFGVAVARMVHGLTNDRPEGMNREQRKAHNISRLANTANDVKTIKLADSIANMRDVIREDPKFAPIYLAEKRQLIDEALKEGCPVLWAMADNIIKDYDVAQRSFNCETDKP